MGNIISHAANLVPWDICVRSLEIIGQSADQLADLQNSHRNGVLIGGTFYKPVF